MVERYQHNTPAITHSVNLKIKESYLRAINQFALTLIEISTVDQLLWYVASEVVGKLDFVDCVIYLVDVEHNELVQRAAIGAKSPEKNVILNRLKIPIGSGITGTVAKSKEPIIVTNTEKDERYLADIDKAGSEICVPMIYDGEVLGVIDSEHPKSDYFSDSHLEVLTTIAAMTSAKISQCKTQAQTRAQARIIQQVSEAVLLINETGTIIDCNPGAEALHDMSKENLIGTNVRNIIIDNYVWKSLIHELKNKIKRSGRWNGRIGLKGPAGIELMTEVSVTKQSVSDSNETVYISVARDISEQVEKERLERELQQAQKMESLGHLTGGVAHDFNNLLGIISGYSDLALSRSETSRDEKLKNHIIQIQDAARRATNLVMQMLTFTRSEAIQKTPVHLATLLQDDITMIRATLPSTIELVTDIEPGLPKVLIDPTQIHQILMNLSINARDAIDGIGQLNIKLAWAINLDTESPVSHKPIKGDWLELSVTDTGTGIETTNIKKIFNPFFTTKEVGKGTGMGLSVIYKIMEDHNGHILIDSELGIGSTFRLLFQPSKEEDIILDNSEEEQSFELPTGDGSNILVVDDEESLGLYLSQRINEIGYKATCVADSAEALKLFKNEPDLYSLLITDQTMPKITGIELISKLRDIRPDFPVILCSGYSNKVDAIKAAKLGLPFFEKPIDINKLLGTIAILLKG